MISTLSNNSSITTKLSLAFTIFKNSTSRYVSRGFKSETVQIGSKEIITRPEKCKQATKSEIDSVPDWRPLDTYLDVKFLKIVNTRESFVVIEELLLSVLIINKVTQIVFYSVIIIKIPLSSIQSL